MLAMNEALMGEMGTPHLLAALEAEGPLTPAEKVLAWRLEKEYESAMEQSSFHAQAIEEILEICEQGGTAKDMKARIKTLIENSYVEL